MVRAFRRTDIPLWYTEGFNPHPHLVFGMSLPLGVEGLYEPLDIRLNDENYPLQRVIDELNRVTVPGIKFIEITEPKNKPLEIFSADYSAQLVGIDLEGIGEKIKEIIASETLTYEKKVKKGGFKTINVTENLKNFEVTEDNGGVLLKFNLPAGNDFTVSPVNFCNLLTEKLCRDDLLWRITRHKLLMKNGADFI
jgi:radical SAM-linked protein